MRQSKAGQHGLMSFKRQTGRHRRGGYRVIDHAGIEGVMVLVLGAVPFSPVVCPVLLGLWRPSRKPACPVAVASLGSGSISHVSG